MSEDFKTFIETLKEDYDYVIADTPPWTTFVDANVISKLFNKVFYVIGNKISTFKDIDLFEKDIENKSKVHYFLINLIFTISFYLNTNIPIILEIIIMIMWIIKM